MIPIVYSNSAPAIKMADWLSLFSALIIVGCFLLLARFIVSLGVMEREAMFNLNLPRREIPSKQMIEVKNPFVLKLKSLHSTSTADSGVIEFLLSTTSPCYLTLYWEVRKDVIDSVLGHSHPEQQTSSFDDAENGDDDLDLEDVPIMTALPLEHFLQGSYKERGTSEFYDSGVDHTIIAVPPTDLKIASLSSHTSEGSNSTYSLVVTVEMCPNDEQGPQQLADIVALMTAVQLSNTSAGKPTSNVVMQFVQTAEGIIHSMKKLFVVESDDPIEMQWSSSTQRTATSSAGVENSTVSSNQLTNAVCIICLTLPVTRAFLPCRHACACGLCCQQLSYCPMCRALIQSYFIVQDEPFIGDAESGTSSELRGMSLGEILRGVLSAS